MTYGDWDKVIEAMPQAELEAAKAALAVLRRWEPFYREFKGFGTFNLESLLAYQIEARQCEAEGIRRSASPRWFNGKTCQFELIPADDAEEVRP